MDREYGHLFLIITVAVIIVVMQLCTRRDERTKCDLPSTAETFFQTIQIQTHTPGRPELAPCLPSNEPIFPLCHTRLTKIISLVRALPSVWITPGIFRLAHLFRSTHKSILAMEVRTSVHSTVLLQCEPHFLLSIYSMMLHSTGIQCCKPMCWKAAGC